MELVGPTMTCRTLSIGTLSSCGWHGVSGRMFRGLIASVRAQGARGGSRFRTSFCTHGNAYLDAVHRIKDVAYHDELCLCHWSPRHCLLDSIWGPVKARKTSNYSWKSMQCCSQSGDRVVSQKCKIEFEHMHAGMHEAGISWAQGIMMGRIGCCENGVRGLPCLWEITMPTPDSGSFPCSSRYRCLCNGLSVRTPLLHPWPNRNS